MLILGLLLLAAATVVAVAMYNDNTSPMEAVSLFGETLPDMTMGEFFLAGAVTGLVFGLGLSMLLAGMGRARRKRSERRRLVKQGRSADELARENERLAAELEQKDRADGYADDRPDHRADTAIYPSDHAVADDEHTERRGWRRKHRV